MKITTKTTSYIIALTIIYIIDLMVTIFCLLNKIHLNNLFIILSEVAYIIPIIYMVMILSYLGERKTIRAAYWAYIICDVGMLFYYLTVKPSGHSLTPFLFPRFLAIAITFILIIQSFRIKNEKLIYPFCLYWMILLGVLFVKLIGWFTMISRWTVKIYQFGIIIEILLPLSLLYILFQTFKYLKNIELPQPKTENEMGGY